MAIRRRDKRVWFLALGIFSAVFLFSFLTQKFKSLEESAEAVSLANFDPGYIISDYQMGNYNSMSEAEIQKFLTSKNPCSNRDYGYYQRLSANNPNVKWHFSDGHFVCLSEELFGDGEVIGSGETAAHIIWQAAQDYKINPQVLIVLLQKESGLITDPIPNNVDYRTATGYGCPDTAPCSSEYFGLKNQIRKAAALFRTVLDGGWTNYPLGNNYIQYNPSASCGGSVVNIRSLATSALYRYTPYQPNAGALAAGYGTAECGAYGNRNFYLYFEDWFGGVTDTKSQEEIENSLIKEKFDKYDYSGTYNILYSENNNKAISVNNNNIETVMYNNSKAQQWVVKKEEDYYIITNKSTGKALDLSGGAFSNKANIWQYNLNKTCAQRWNFVKNSDGTVTIHSVCYPKYVLDLADGDSNVQVYTKTNYENSHQKWVMRPTTVIGLMDGDYNIFADGLMKVVGSINGNVKAGDYQNIESKIWSIARVSNGAYVITDKKTHKVIGIKTNNIENKTNVTECSTNEDCLYYWYFEEFSDGVYIRNFYNLAYVLDLADGNSNVQVYTKINNNNHQKWHLTKADEVDYSGTYNILYSENNNKVIDVVDNNIETAVYNNSKTQQWVIKKEEDYYTITNKSTGKALDLSGGVFSNKANIWQYNLNRTCAQRWNFIKNSDGTVTIHSVCYPKYVLDLADGNSNVQVYTKTDYENLHQKWVMQPN